jgi:hypothetical protein
VILGIVGTRHLGQPRYREYAGALITYEITSGEWDSVVTGDASGVDELTRDLCDTFGLPCEVLAPKFRRWEPYGFKERNMRICHIAGALLCIRDPGSLTYGSGWTANYFMTLDKGSPWIAEFK